MIFRSLLLSCAALSMSAGPTLADGHLEGNRDKPRFTAERVFDIEYATDPQISPDGESIVYIRRSMDRSNDQDRGDLWIVNVKSGAHRPLVAGGASASSPRWSPDGSRLLYMTSNDGRPELRLRYMDNGQDVSLAQLYEGPSGADWSPDGSMIAFTMFVEGETPSFAKPIKAPKDAKWSDPVRVFDGMTFRFDAQGYLRNGARHTFVLSADGGSPRQITTGDQDMTHMDWLNDRTLLVNGNQAEDADLDPIESEIYAVNVANGSMTPLTSRDGPDGGAAVSPNGRMIAFTGYNDKRRAYQQADLYVMNADGSNKRELLQGYDRAFGTLKWGPDNRTLYAQVENAGVIEVVSVDTRSGRRATVTHNVGGTSIGRPYAAGSFSVSQTGSPRLAFTHGTSERPADIATQQVGSSRETVLTDLNGDVLPYLDMAKIEEIKVKSSFDGREIEAWVALPPDFKADGSFPMILEIHGGPQTMYGPFFAGEIQRYAAEGYVTVYANPRGSTGYGDDFVQAIDLNYPGEDHNDLMDVVDAVVARNYVDEDRLFITGGSGGGILTAWAVTKTDRFAAAASVKPVINWMTMALAADIGQFIRRHWIRADPWSDPDAYLSKSPIMNVDKVTTPTLMMVGEEDWRTPTWEAEQFYTGLKMNGVDTALIRIPGSPHYIAGRPSRLIAKTDNIMGWFRKYDPAFVDDTTD